MTSLQEQVHQSIRSRRLFRAGQAILVAVSGGVDSMVLLHVLHALSRQAGWRLSVAHLNHKLRGRSSDADARFVRRAADRLQLPITLECADVRAAGSARKLSVEMAARELRHDFLARTAARLKIRSVALAHHMDDQIELFFLRLLRGSGGDGLAGMKWCSPSPNDPGIELVRPLLGLTKDSLLRYADQEGISFREDATNAQLDIQRNRIRHELLPLLRTRYQPALGNSILRVMDIVGAEAEFATAAAKSWLQNELLPRSNAAAPVKPVAPQSSGVSFLLGQDQPRFERLPVAVQRRCLQLQLLAQGIVPDFDLIEQLRLHPDKTVSAGKGPLPGGSSTHASGSSEATSLSWLVRRDNDGRVRRVQARSLAFKPGAKRVDLGQGRGDAEWDGVRFTWRILPGERTARPKTPRGSEFFDADSIGPRIVLRHWKPGDRFQQIGTDRPAKLQDLFVNQKVPHILRRQGVVGCTARGELFWVEGLRVSERFKLTKSTIRRLQWAWHRL